MSEGIWGWDYANHFWVRVRVDANGYLQTAIFSSVLPTGAATEATLALIEGAVDGIEGALGQCYGWTGAAWTELLVESAASANLRTRLYDGVNPIISVGTGADIADANRGLFTQAGVRGWDGTFWKSVNVEDGAGDALANARASLSTVSKLYGFNGVTWDRLRTEADDAFNLRVKLYDGANGVWVPQFIGASLTATSKYHLANASILYCSKDATSVSPVLRARSSADGVIGNFFFPVALKAYNGAFYDRLRSYPTGILKVARAEAGLSTALKVAVGAVKASAGKLYWVTMNGGAGNTRVELSDDLDGSTAAVYALQCLQNCVAHVVLDPPMEFATGIWLKTFTNATDTILGYL